MLVQRFKDFIFIVPPGKEIECKGQMKNNKQGKVPPCY